MSKLYTGIDIGTNSVKIIVAEKTNDKFKILAKSETKTKGLKRGLIIDAKEVATSVSNCLKKIEDILGVPIKKLLPASPQMIVFLILLVAK